MPLALTATTAEILSMVDAHATKLKEQALLKEGDLIEYLDVGMAPLSAALVPSDRSKPIGRVRGYPTNSGFVESITMDRTGNEMVVSCPAGQCRKVTA